MKTPTILKLNSMIRLGNRCLNRRLYSQKFGSAKAGPVPLPKEEQEEFEKLQRLANSQAAIDEYNKSVTLGKSQGDDPDNSPQNLKTDIGGFQNNKIIPEFEGDVNPKTGEIGGPKQDPIKHGDWSFNGRVTDF